MKYLISKLLFIRSSIVLIAIVFATAGSPVVSQDAPLSGDDPPLVHIIIKNDGTRFVGTIISRDAREVLIDTPNLGEIFIPMHEIREIREAKPSEVSPTGEYIPGEVFSTRYFITTNGLPIEKGESYIQWNLYGPDFQFGVGENFGLGILTTWFGSPLIGSAKYSIDLPGNLSLGAGLLVGSGSWAMPDLGLILPFGAFTIGDRVSNLTFSFGYGGATYKESNYNPISNRETEKRISDGRMLFSIAGMAKAGKKLSLVFDSFIVLPGGYREFTEYNFDYSYDPVTGNYSEKITAVTKKERRGGITLLIPGIRLQTEPNKAFQFGFAGLYFDGELIPTPIPMVTWYRML